MSKGMGLLRFISAVALGLVLATIPFLRYAASEHDHGKAHMDHTPHHGGQLGMVGDHHVEVVRRNGRVEVFVSDAYRRPVEAVSGRLVFAGDKTVAMERAEGKLVCEDVASARELEVEATLTDGTKLAVSFAFPSL
jgi:hypothetical protein